MKLSEMFYNNITVTLSSSAKSCADMTLQKLDIAVCLVEMILETNDYEHIIELITSMAQIVDIDTDKRTIKIKDDKHPGELVDFQANLLNKSIHHDAFFKRWQETHFLIFEFQIKSLKGNVILAVKGIYDNDHWAKLEKAIPSFEQYTFRNNNN